MGGYLNRHYYAHAEAFRRHMRDYRKRKRANGICIYGGCSEPSGGSSSWLCDAHNELQRQHALLRRQERSGTGHTLTPA